MNLYEACKELNIWDIARARAQIWSQMNKYHEESVIELHVLAKNNFKKLASIHHPDVGGDNDKYLYINEALKIIQNSNGSHFIYALEEEKKVNVKYYTPNSNECLKCSKWSSISETCITTTCSGFDSLKKPTIVYNNNYSSNHNSNVSGDK